MAPTPHLTVYEAWQSTLAPFLVPACVLSAWPVFMIVGASNRIPLKMLCIYALVSFADGLLGSCAFPLMHQYAFTPAQNNTLFYIGSICYWLSGLLLGPAMEIWGMRKSCLVLGAAGVFGAFGSMQDIFFFMVLGRCCSSTVTAGLTTLVEHVLYDEAHLRPSSLGEPQPEKAHTLSRTNNATSNNSANSHDAAGGLGGGMLTMYHQLRPLTLWAAMLLGQYTMIYTPHVSAGPCWAAMMCYSAVLGLAYKTLPPWSAREAFKFASRGKGLSNRVSPSTATTNTVEWDRPAPGLAPTKPLTLPLGFAFAPSTTMMTGSRVLQRWLRGASLSYVEALKTLVHPKQLARHLVDILFGGLFFVLSLLWVPTLEMYDDSVPFGFIFQVLMIAHFLGSTFSFPVWAVGWAEAGLVVVLSVTARILYTSRDYAVPVTILLAGVAMHFVAGITQTTGSLWRAEYPSTAAPLTFLFVVKALTGLSGWVFLHVIDGKYMEDVFVFEARWVYVLMWLEAVALAQYISKRAAQHRETMNVESSGVRIVTGGVKADNLRENGNESYDATAAVSLEAEPVVHHPLRAPVTSGEGINFRM